MSSRVTSSLSFGHVYCCLRRELHFLCSMLKDTFVFDSEDEYRFTGTDTRPNEIVAVAIERAGIRLFSRMSNVLTITTDAALRCVVMAMTTHFFFGDFFPQTIHTKCTAGAGSDVDFCD